MNKSTHAALLILALACLLLCSCDNSSSSSSPSPTGAPQYYAFNISRAGWDTVLYINGNPALRGGASGQVGAMVNVWMKEGTNAVRITTKLVDDSDYARQECNIQLVKTPNPADPRALDVVGGIYHSPAEADQYEVEFEVEVPKSHAVWLWQQADNIEALTDVDRAAITKLVRGMAGAIRQRNAALALKHMTPVWGNGPCPKGFVPTEKDLESIQVLCAFPDLTVTVAPQDEWEYVVGKQVVLVHKKPTAESADDGSMIYAGHSLDFEPQPGDTTGNMYMYHARLHFIKIDGNWIMLRP